MTWLTRPTCPAPALCSSIANHTGFGCGASCTRALPASSGGGPGAFVTTLPHWGKALSPPREGQEEERKEAEAGWLGGRGLPGLCVRRLTLQARHGTCRVLTGGRGGPVLKSRLYPVRGLERKKNLESSLKEELFWQEGPEEDKRGGGKWGGTSM